MMLRSVAVVACLAVVSPPMASDARTAVRRPTAVPAEALGPALQTLAEEYGFQLVYVSEEVTPHRTAGISGDLTTEEALTLLLDGTGLTYRYQGDGVAITPVPAPLTCALSF
jgi:Secretin and TonB N terminus short domain